MRLDMNSLRLSQPAKRLLWWPGNLLIIMLVLSMSTAQAVHAQTETILHNFADGSVPNDGKQPDAALVKGSDGNFYGTTQLGGSTYGGSDLGSGTVFKITPLGIETVLHKFYDGSVPSDGAGPGGALIEGRDGSFYGTTEYGGTTVSRSLLGSGTVFKITSSGMETILHNFGDGSVSNDGFEPAGALIQGSDGNFYGVTFAGGSAGSGTVFKMTPSGIVTILHSFQDANESNDGRGPRASLVQGSDGDFYGMTFGGGLYDNGTVFKMTTAGTETILHSFNGTDGALPEGSLIQDSGGDFYGTTAYGGSAGSGTLFKMTPSGTETILHNFSDGSVPNDGNAPVASLVQGIDGNFYGTTFFGGVAAEGTVFKMTPSGAVTILHSFGNSGVVNDGDAPDTSLVRDDNGGFYGLTLAGGSANSGTVFRLSPVTPLPPTLTGFTPGEGPDGSTVTLTGTSLSGVTAVRFHDASAKVFAASADGTQLTVTVPRGARNGMITVTTPSGSVKTTRPFRVTHAPIIASFNPASGPVGTVVTITGTHLSGITRVRFHNADASIYSSNADGTQLTVTLPSGAATGTITLDNRDVLGTTSSGVFTVTP